MKTSNNELRKEYDLSKLKGERRKYYQQAAAGSNLILIDPDLVGFFPDGESVNRALLLAEAARVGNPAETADKSQRRTRYGFQSTLKMLNS
jgi:hypothetical protein